jgi:hypothetical protein
MERAEVVRYHTTGNAVTERDAAVVEYGWDMEWAAMVRRIVRPTGNCWCCPDAAVTAGLSGVRSFAEEIGHAACGAARD